MRISVRTHLVCKIVSTFELGSSSCCTIKAIHSLSLATKSFHRRRSTHIFRRVTAAPPSFAPVAIPMETILTVANPFPQVGSHLAKSAGPCHVTLNAPVQRVVFLCMPSICATHFCSTHPSFDWVRFLQKYRNVGDVPPSPRRSATVFSAPLVGLRPHRVNVEMYFLSRHTLHVSKQREACVVSPRYLDVA